MTIGPDPMTSTLWMSVRLGIGEPPVPRLGDGSSPACSPPAVQEIRAADRGHSPARGRHGDLVLAVRPPSREGERRPRALEDRPGLPADLDDRIEGEVVPDE